MSRTHCCSGGGGIFLFTDTLPACLPSPRIFIPPLLVPRPPPGFVFKVYVADVQTLSSHSSRFLPTVVLSLLDFEPIVFDLSRKIPPTPNGGGWERGRGVSGGGGAGGGSGSGSNTVGEKACRGGQEAQQRDYFLSGDNHSDDDSHRDGEHGARTGVSRGDDRSYPTSFSFNKGKSCVFTADPANLSRALCRRGSLTLMVASKLTQNQVRGEGVCAS